jgi:hypothetical protein
MTDNPRFELSRQIELLRLLRERQELFDSPVVGIELCCNCPCLVGVIGETRGWREVEVVEPGPGVVEDRIHDDVELSQVPT